MVHDTTVERVTNRVWGIFSSLDHGIAENNNRRALLRAHIASLAESYRQILVMAGAGQAAAVVGWRSVGLAMTSIPSLNVTPRTSFGNWL
jgi:hypothetical protein